MQNRTPRPSAPVKPSARQAAKAKLRVINPAAEAPEPEPQPLVADLTGHQGTDYYLVDELLTPKERAVRDKVGRFADEAVIPIINDYWEAGEFPFELVPKLAKLNIAGGTIRGHGCPGLSTVAVGMVGMELSRGD